MHSIVTVVDLVKSANGITCTKSRPVCINRISARDQSTKAFDLAAHELPKEKKKMNSHHFSINRISARDQSTKALDLAAYELPEKDEFTPFQCTQ